MPVYVCVLRGRNDTIRFVFKIYITYNFLLANNSQTEINNNDFKYEPQSECHKVEALTWALDLLPELLGQQCVVCSRMGDFCPKPLPSSGPS